MADIFNDYDDDDDIDALLDGKIEPVPLPGEVKGKEQDPATVAIQIATAEQLHGICMKAKKVGNRCRHKLIVALFTLAQTRLYYKLSATSITQYCALKLGYGRTKTSDSIRVAKKLPELPESTRRYDDGEMCWSILKLFSRVDTEATEKVWIQYAQDHTYKELTSEVKHALHEGRDVPRKDGFGIRNVTVRMVIPDLTLDEEHEIAVAFEKVAGEMKESLELESEDGEPRAITRKDVILYIAHRINHTDLPDSLVNRKQAEESPHQIAFKVNEKGQAAVRTRDAWVEVPIEKIRRIEGDARVTVITAEEEREGARVHGRIAGGGDCGHEHDHAHEDEGQAPGIDIKNTEELARKVKVRDGCVCANPCCGRRSSLHAHHVVYRWRKGPTEMWNEVTVCVTCHCLLHLGLIVIEEKPEGGWRWIRRMDGLVLDTAREAKEEAEIPAVVVPASAIAEPIDADSAAREGEPRAETGAAGEVTDAVASGAAGPVPRGSTLDDRMAALVLALCAAGFKPDRAG